MSPVRVVTFWGRVLKRALRGWWTWVARRNIVEAGVVWLVGTAVAFMVLGWQAMLSEMAVGLVYGLAPIGGLMVIVAIWNLIAAPAQIDAEARKEVNTLRGRISAIDRQFDRASLHAEYDTLSDERMDFWPALRRMYLVFAPDDDRLGAFDSAGCPTTAFEDADLLRFCRSVYPEKGATGDPRDWWKNSEVARHAGITEPDFVRFHKARAKLRSYYEVCARKIGSSDSFDEFMYACAVGWNPAEWKILAYLDVALADITGKAHLLRLPDAPGWKLIDRFVSGYHRRLAGAP